MQVLQGPLGGHWTLASVGSLYSTDFTSLHRQNLGKFFWALLDQILDTLLFLEKFNQDVIGTGRETNIGSIFIAIVKLNQCQIFLLMFTHQWRKTHIRVGQTFASLNNFVSQINYLK